MTTGTAAMPRREVGVHLDTSAGANILVSESGEEMLLLNETALALWELCDGQTTLGEMVTAITDFFAAEPVVIHRDVEGALQQLVEAGVVLWS
jgi:coenzyme PQQ synthesis protein D (PqqD)